MKISDIDFERKTIHIRQSKYKKDRKLPEAAAVLEHALALDPANTKVMANLVSVLTASGRMTDAVALTAKLDRLEPNPPFAYLNRGMTALRSGDYRSAREQFAKEIARAPYNDELHYWLAVAYAGLGENGQARIELAKALEYSTTRKDHDLYAAKLERIRMGQVR